MKKIILLIAIVISITINSTYAQNENKNITYSFINEYGLFFGGGEADATIGLSGVFVNGIKMNDQHFFGIGLGYETDVMSGQSIPIFLNYRYFFHSDHKLKPLVNFGLGTRFSYWSDEEIVGYDPYYGYPIYQEVQKSAFGFYSTIAAGFTINSFSFTSGLFLKSMSKDFIAGFEVKAGFTL